MQITDLTPAIEQDAFSTLIETLRNDFRRQFPHLKAEENNCFFVRRADRNSGQVWIEFNKMNEGRRARCKITITIEENRVVRRVQDITDIDEQLEGTAPVCPMTERPNTVEPARLPMKDHRRMKRKLARKSVSVICRKGTLGLGPNLAVRMHDLSVDGAQLVINSPLAKGDVIEVCFSAPGIFGKLSREATVAWCSDTLPEGYRIGARFQRPLAYEQVFQMT
jgi:hypothetical protein